MKRIAIPIFFTCFFAHTIAVAQVTNPDFESTTSGSTGTIPVNWVIGSSYGAGLSTDAHSGTNAIQVWNWYFYGPGYVSNGSSATGFGLPTPGEPFLYNGEPISFKPFALTGFYKYDTTLNGGAIDSGIVQITLSKYNISTGLRESVGFGEVRLPVINNYTSFNVPINYSSTLVPDTVVVAIRSSVNGFCSTSSSGTCLYLTVDDLALSTSSGTVEWDDKDLDSRVYPNPASNFITIENLDLNASMYQCNITNAMGQWQTTTSILNNTTTINVEGFKPGLYFYYLMDQQGEIHCQGKFQIIH